MPKRTNKAKEENVEVLPKLAKKEKAKPKKVVEENVENEEVAAEENKRPTRVAKSKPMKVDTSNEDEENVDDVNKENKKKPRIIKRQRQRSASYTKNSADQEEATSAKQARKPREKKTTEKKTNDSGDAPKKEPEVEKKESKKVAAKKEPKKAANNDDESVPKKKNPPKKAAKGKAKKDLDEDELEKKPSKKAAVDKSGDKKTVKNKTETDFTSIDYSCERLNQNGEAWNFKISSWNVDGIRAWCNKGSLEFINHEKPDVFCIQETKCSLEKLPAEVKEIEGYHAYWSAAEKDGYSGVGLYSKEKPLSVQYGIESAEHEVEGRIITAEYEKFYVVSVYVPNAGRGLVTMPKRLSWNTAFQNYLKKLDQVKPVIICGDMNVAHQEIDLKNPKTNKKTAGFTQEERDGMTDLLGEGFVDTFRNIYPDKKEVYTFWSYMNNARVKNIGWRIDYFLVSERFMPTICDHVVRSEAFGSDHCPITLFLRI